MKITIIVAVIIALPFIIALFTTKVYTVERDITINKPARDVFSYIRLVKNQEHYSAWVMADPNSKKVYNGTDGSKGFSMSWDSQLKNVGAGSQTITNIVEGQRIDADLKFIRPFKGESKASIIAEAASPSQTKVRWIFNGQMNYPMNFTLVFLNMDKLLGEQLDTSLKTLKSVLEQ